MADAVVSYTIEKLKEFVTEQVSIRTGVKDGIEWLKDELGYLLISVRVAEAHQDKDHIRLWTDSVRDVSNQAVIIMERFSAQQEEHAAAEQGGVLDRILAFCCRFICIYNKEANLFDIGKEIEALKEKITGIKSRRDEYHINDIIMAAPIDDIWDVEVWKKIKYAFPDKKNGSRVINYANRNMIQMQLLSLGGQVLRCRVHDLVRALAIEKAMKHKILGIFDSSKERANPIRLLQGQSRHAIYNGIGQYLKLLGRNSDVSMFRSFAITKKGIFQPKVEEVKLMYTRFKYLKVLDFSSVGSLWRMPEEIGDLIFLKFLGLVNTFLTSSQPLVIPPSIGKLKNLQTLIGHGRYIFPKETCELKEIRHLCFSEIKGKLNIGKDQTKLQSIDYISYTEWFQIDTINWTNLRTLVISGSGEGEAAGYNFESMANLTNLRTLRLTMTNHFPSTIQPLSSCKNLKKVILNGKIKDPEELSFLPYSVTDLTLRNTDFRKDPMPTLRRLSNLTALAFIHAYTGDKMVCSADAFPCLQFFRVQWLRNLRELQVDDGALPSLKAFQIHDCPLIEMDRIPQRVKSLPPGLPIFDVLDPDEIFLCIR